MSTLTEIEAAITSLAEPQVVELAAWLDERRKAQLNGVRINPSPSVPSVREFFGQFSSGMPRGADNEEIDCDLARGAAEGLS